MNASQSAIKFEWQPMVTFNWWKIWKKIRTRI